MPTETVDTAGSLNAAIDALAAAAPGVTTIGFGGGGGGGYLHGGAGGFGGGGGGAGDESYLDTGNRAVFANVGTTRRVQARD